MTFGENVGPYGAAEWIREADALPISRRAFDADINLVDTANVYAQGRSEEIVGRAIGTLGVARADVMVLSV